MTGGQPSLTLFGFGVELPLLLDCEMLRKVSRAVLDETSFDLDEQGPASSRSVELGK